jgi:hypothetical protein
MSFGKKTLTGPDIQVLQGLSERQKLELTEQYMLDRIHGRTTCRFCRQPLDDPRYSCPKCSIYKRSS